jgi:hypothetical protein
MLPPTRLRREGDDVAGLALAQRPQLLAHAPAFGHELADVHIRRGARDGAGQPGDGPFEGRDFRFFVP